MGAEFANSGNQNSCYTTSQQDLVMCEIELSFSRTGSIQYPKQWVSPGESVPKQARI